MANDRLSHVTWLRATSAILILLCHYCSQSAVVYIKHLAQIFNIGVQLFIIISGVLAGYRAINIPYYKWYIKRFKRIYIPF